MELTDQNYAVALFVRHPVPGRVKTRLAGDLGAVAACQLYQAMVADSIANITSAGLPLYLFHDGRSSAGLPQEWLSAATGVVAQSGAGLDDRMTAAFEGLFSMGQERVILTGSDIPGIDGPLLHAAAAALDGHDVAFAPALDGGYCLVAFRNDSFNSCVFQGISWSTPAVMEQTLAACRERGLPCALLDSRQDIDTLSDLTAYCRRPSPAARLTNAWLASNGFVLPSEQVRYGPVVTPATLP